MGLREDIESAIEKIRAAPSYQRQPLDPIHPRDYAMIQADLGTTEPLTEQQVIEWAWGKVLHGKAGST